VYCVRRAGGVFDEVALKFLAVTLTLPKHEDTWGSNISKTEHSTVNCRPSSVLRLSLLLSLAGHNSHLRSMQLSASRSTVNACAMSCGPRRGSRFHSLKFPIPLPKTRDVVQPFEARKMLDVQYAACPAE
jgi:hypothetical protein